MSDELRVVIKKYDDLPKPSQLALEKVLADYGMLIMQAAESIEKARRATSRGPAPMVTDTALVLADLNVRNGQIKHVPTMRFKVFSILEYAATFAGGGFAAYISKPSGAIGFAICAVLAILMHTTKKGDDD
jgi:hypothetical protein